MKLQEQLLLTPADAQVTAENVPCDALKLSKNVRFIRSICGYTEDSGKLQPIWGDLIGLWHRVSGDLISVEHPQFWDILEALHTHNFDFTALAASIARNLHLESDQATLMRSVQLLCDLGFIETRENKSIISITDVPTRCEVYMHMTEDCNFSCHNCCTHSDLLRGPSAKSIDRELLHSGVERIIADSASNGFKELTFKWAGGEPTLKKSFDLIIDIQPYITAWAEKYGITVAQTILSNGVPLNKDKIKFLKEHAIHTVISFWGLENDNESLRSPDSKTKTFNRVRENIRTCAELEVDFNVLIVLLPNNVHLFADLLSALWDPTHPQYFLRGLSVTDPIKVAINFIRPQSNDELPIILAQHPEMINGIRAGFDRIISLIDSGYAVAVPDILDYINLSMATTRTCGAGLSYGSFGPNGIGACHEQASDKSLMPLLEQLFQGSNFWQLVRSSFNEADIPLLNAVSGLIAYDSDARLDLALHGGMGCPRSRCNEDGRLKNTISELYNIYTQIYMEFLTVYFMGRKQNKRVQSVATFKHQPCSECNFDCSTQAALASFRKLSDIARIDNPVKLLSDFITAHPDLALNMLFVKGDCVVQSKELTPNVVYDSKLLQNSPVGSFVQLNLDCPNTDNYTHIVLYHQYPNQAVRVV